MDPVTVVGFLVAVVQLIDVTSKVVTYFNDVKDAPKERAKLAREATGLLALFTDLRYRMEETASTDPWFSGLQSLGGEGGPLMEFKSAMEDIADKLAPPTRVVNLRRVLSWTLDKKEIGAILSKIERLKTLVGLALQKDHFKLSLAMKEDISVGFQETIMEFRGLKINRDVEKINQWLAAPLPSSNHNTAVMKRQARTGEWFTQSNDFADWKIGKSSFIWLHGIPGCGKTVLCSTVIQDVISYYLSEPTVAVAYFYFDFNDLDQQRTEKLIRSLIVQLLAQRQHLPESLQLAYSRSHDGRNQLRIDELTMLLCEMMECFKSTYILLDALDECKDRKDLFEFIETLMSWNIDDLHVLATSRKENDIVTSLEPLVTCQIPIQSALVDADIRVHVLERLSKHPKLKRWPPDVQKEIEDALVRGAKGMFRWVVCQLDSLQKCLNLSALRKALNTLPKTLDETYERILSNIYEEYEEDALKIFRWLCCSLRPMRLDEMVEVLAIDSTSESCFRPEQRLLDPCDILIICSTLVSITAAAKKDRSTRTTETRELRLAHFSVKEYLISDRLKRKSIQRYHITPLSANISIAKTCLAYLLHFKNPIILTAKFDHDFPFMRYAAEFWPWHYKYITDGAGREAVYLLGCNLVKSKHSCFKNWLGVFHRAERHWSEPESNLEINRDQSPLYNMSYVGFSEFLELFWNKEANANAEDGAYDNALSAASYTNQEGMGQVSLRNETNEIAEEGIDSSWLSVASCKGQEKMIRFLLEKGADVHARCGKYGSALSVASFQGHENVVRLLLEIGANVNAQDIAHGNALFAASFSGHNDVVHLLLEKGANVNAENEIYGHALTAASHKGHEEVVRTLLENGANVDAQSEDGPFSDALSAVSYNALFAASYKGHEKVVRLLIEFGANVNAEHEMYGNALSISIQGHKDVVRLLLEKGANVNAESVHDSVALSVASFEGHENVVRLLLENGADVNAHNGWALRAAIYNGQKAVILLLLRYKADVDLASLSR